jgi:hypothetical protein
MGAHSDGGRRNGLRCSHAFRESCAGCEAAEASRVLTIERTPISRGRKAALIEAVLTDLRLAEACHQFVSFKRFTQNAYGAPCERLRAQIYLTTARYHYNGSSA